MRRKMRAAPEPVRVAASTCSLGRDWQLECMRDSARIAHWPASCTSCPFHRTGDARQFPRGAAFTDDRVMPPPPVSRTEMATGMIVNASTNTTTAFTSGS
jgi:hypothetical protein